MAFPATPFLKINTSIIDANIRNMVEKADRCSVIFRPHFKTHQSAEIGRLFKKYNVDRITVSSLDMAVYFSASGWSDILVAVPVNIREIDTIRLLSEKIRLGLLVDNADTLDFLISHLTHPVDMWIKVDCGYRRAGIPWDRPADIHALAEKTKRSSNMHFKGILTHAGDTYHAASVQEIRFVFNRSVARMNTVRNGLEKSGFQNIIISAGDTPGCVLSPDFKGVDEIRPGNFVFFDAMMLLKGVCSEDQIAVQAGFPVTGVYKDRGEVVVMGGAVHLSKEAVMKDGCPVYGLVADGQGEVISLSQEHGVVRVSERFLKSVRTGDILFIYPVHSCLTANLHRMYFSDTGESISKR